MAFSFICHFAAVTVVFMLVVCSRLLLLEQAGGREDGQEFGDSKFSIIGRSALAGLQCVDCQLFCTDSDSVEPETGLTKKALVQQQKTPRNHPEGILIDLIGLTSRAC